MSSWSDARVDALKAGRARGETFSSLARSLNDMPGTKLSRNAVIGKASRLNLPKFERPSAPRTVKMHPLKARAEKTSAPAPQLLPARGKILAGHKLPPPTPEVAAAFAASGKARIIAFEAAAPEGGVSFLALESGMCRRPLRGEGADMVCCGQRTEYVRRGGYASYCIPCHRQLVTLAPKVYENKLTKYVTSGSVRRGYPS